MLILVIFGFRVGREIYYQQRYPLEYKEIIEEYANQYNLDPYLVASVIWVESKFDKDAQSGKGALGLMQIMPDTGEWIAGKEQYTDFTATDLFEPEISIALGCWYLNYLNERFSYNMPLVLAAYNSGPGRVDEWLANEDYAEGDRLVHIPYGETEDFVKRVEKTYEIYQELYTFDE
ncbi:MAG: lytic transglycosylase domain-containing protein [Eubacteriales bacterium]